MSSSDDSDGEEVMNQDHANESCIKNDADAYALRYLKKAQSKGYVENLDEVKVDSDEEIDCQLTIASFKHKEKELGYPRLKTRNVSTLPFGAMVLRMTRKLGCHSGGDLLKVPETKKKQRKERTKAPRQESDDDFIVDDTEIDPPKKSSRRKTTGQKKEVVKKGKKEEEVEQRMTGRPPKSSEKTEMKEKARARLISQSSEQSTEPETSRKVNKADVLKKKREDTKTRKTESAPKGGSKMEKKKKKIIEESEYESDEEEESSMGSTSKNTAGHTNHLDIYREKRKKDKLKKIKRMEKEKMKKELEKRNKLNKARDAFGEEMGGRMEEEEEERDYNGMSGDERGSRISSGCATPIRSRSRSRCGSPDPDGGGGGRYLTGREKAVVEQLKKDKTKKLLEDAARKISAAAAESAAGPEPVGKRRAAARVWTGGSRDAGISDELPPIGGVKRTGGGMKIPSTRKESGGMERPSVDAAPGPKPATLTAGNRAPGGSSKPVAPTVGAHATTSTVNGAAVPKPGSSGTGPNTTGTTKPGPTATTATNGTTKPGVKPISAGTRPILGPAAPRPNPAYVGTRPTAFSTLGPKLPAAPRPFPSGDARPAAAAAAKTQPAARVEVDLLGSITAEISKTMEEKEEPVVKKMREEKSNPPRRPVPTAVRPPPAAPAPAAAAAAAPPPDHRPSVPFSIYSPYIDEFPIENGQFSPGPSTSRDWRREEREEEERRRRVAFDMERREEEESAPLHDEAMNGLVEGEEEERRGEGGGGGERQEQADNMMREEQREQSPPRPRSVIGRKTRKEGNGDEVIIDLDDDEEEDREETERHINRVREMGRTLIEEEWEEIEKSLEYIVNVKKFNPFTEWRYRSFLYEMIREEDLPTDGPLRDKMEKLFRWDKMNWKMDQNSRRRRMEEEWLKKGPIHRDWPLTLSLLNEGLVEESTGLFDRYGEYPLEVAVGKERFEWAKFLLEREAGPVWLIKPAIDWFLQDHKKKLVVSSCINLLISYGDDRSLAIRELEQMQKRDEYGVFDRENPSHKKLLNDIKRADTSLGLKLRTAVGQVTDVFDISMTRSLQSTAVLPFFYQLKMDEIHYHMGKWCTEDTKNNRPILLAVVIGTDRSYLDNIKVERHSIKTPSPSISRVMGGSEFEVRGGFKHHPTKRGLVDEMSAIPLHSFSSSHFIFPIPTPILPYLQSIEIHMKGVDVSEIVCASILQMRMQEHLEESQREEIIEKFSAGQFAGYLNDLESA